MESPFNQIALRSPFFDTGLSAFTPLSLFSASEPGAWYDPSDMSTMFQDFNGATPVSAVEQPVSVILDKSKNGVGTNGTRRLNLLTRTQEFDNAAWSKFRVNITQNAAVAPNGTTTAEKLIPTAVSGTHYVEQPQTYASGSYTASVYAKADGYNFVFIGEAYGSAYGYFNLSNGTTGNKTAGTTTTITSVGNGWYKCDLTFTGGSVSQRGLYIACDQTNGNVSAWTGNGTDGILIWGADLRLAADANVSPTYQPVTDTWYNVQAGNHAYTPSAATASRPVLSARYNLLTKTEQFDDAVWNQGGTPTSTVIANDATAPDGTTTADKLKENAGTVLPTIYFNTAISFTSGAAYTASCYIKSAGRNVVAMYYQTQAFPDSGRTAWFDLSNQTTQVQSGVTASITSVGNDWYRCSITVTADATNSSTANSVGMLLPAGMGNFNTYTGDNTSGIYIWGADLRVANDGVALPVYQRVNTSTDYDTTNFPMYLRFDGSDDYMLTGTITPGTDKAQVFAGVRKLSDATTGVLTELGTNSGTNAGAFVLLAPNNTGASGDFACYSRGTASVASGASSSVILAPSTKVMSSIFAISTDTMILRLDGVQAASRTSDQGSGNFNAQTLYIGRRGGSTLPYNGRLYGAIIRFGANLDNTQITNTETWMNGKTKAY
jgi:hypothetical protein